MGKGVAAWVGLVGVGLLGVELLLLLGFPKGGVCGFTEGGVALPKGVCLYPRGVSLPKGCGFPKGVWLPR